jgi:1-deoxy-D-xylulose-5-phosphate reductoisomerase
VAALKRVLVLGSTGSIGVQALQVIAGSTDLSVVGLSCHSNVPRLLEQAASLGVTELAIADDVSAERVSPQLYPELNLRAGRHAAACLVREVDADLVLNGIVGFAGLEATVAALKEGRPLALANKESLVSGGSFVTGLATRSGVSILPVDSEHSALFQLLAPLERRTVRSLVITASGGPFRGRSRDQLRGVTVEDALAHPTWRMGAKITVDSATLMNKGLELIEAHHLFGVAYPDLEVVLHPQSLVHALVRLVDGALLAHLGMADMRVPIAYALHYPERRPVEVARLDLASAGSLEFEEPDPKTFRCLALARTAGAEGDAATCALNAANEIAVEAFLAQKIGFLGIPEVIERVMERLGAGTAGLPGTPRCFEEVQTVDSWARGQASAACEEVERT